MTRTLLVVSLVLVLTARGFAVDQYCITSKVATRNEGKELWCDLGWNEGLEAACDTASTSGEYFDPALVKSRGRAGKCEGGQYKGEAVTRITR